MCPTFPKPIPCYPYLAFVLHCDLLVYTYSITNPSSKHEQRNATLGNFIRIVYRLN